MTYSRSNSLSQSQLLKIMHMEAIPLGIIYTTVKMEEITITTEEGDLMPTKMDGMVATRELGTIRTLIMGVGAIIMEDGMQTIITGELSRLTQPITADGEGQSERQIITIGATQTPINGAQTTTTQTIGSQQEE
jgi:hypothetical protein